MSIKAKYDSALKLGEELGIKDGYVNEESGKLKMGGTAKTAFEKDRIWDKIKEVGGDSPVDIEADIKVEETAYYHKHIVQSGESLSKIAGMYYNGRVQDYMKIFNANTDTLKDPNMIHPGQELTIPNP